MVTRSQKGIDGSLLAATKETLLAEGMMKNLAWNGSIEAQRQFEEACIKIRPAKKSRRNGKERKVKRSKRCCNPMTYSGRNAILRHHGYADYAAYLRSEVWKSIRTKAFAEHGKRCVGCGQKAHCLHHRIYDEPTLLGDDISGLEPICNDCHNAIEFTREGKKRSITRANKALDGMKNKRRKSTICAAVRSPVISANGRDNRANDDPAKTIDVPLRQSDDERPQVQGLDFLGESQREEKESCGDACLRPGVQTSTDTVCGRGRCATNRHKSAIGPENEITHQLIVAGRSDGGGWTREQFSLIGVEWPPVTGWMNRVIGKEIRLGNALRFIALKNSSKKMRRRNG